MPRYKLTIEYDGTPYVGWQKQEGYASVQAALEKACSAFVRTPVELFCAGRTDAGVHAIGQVVHVDFPVTRTPKSIIEALNIALLKESICVVGAEELPDHFHARFDAKMRHYRYKILNRFPRGTLDGLRTWHIKNHLDIGAMQAAANHLLGTHDFTSFRSSECQGGSPIRTLDAITVERHGEQVWIDVSAQSFLHHQVRTIAGSLVYVGKGTRTIVWMAEALAARDRRAAGPNAPACGLYFMKVDY